MLEKFNPDNPKMLANWFDPTNLEHLRAFKALSKGFGWPKDFYAKMMRDGVIIHDAWQQYIESRIVARWIQEKLGSV